MKPKYQTIIIITVSLLTAFLGWVSHYLKNSFINLSSGNLFGFGFAGLLDIFFPVAFFCLGLVFSGLLLSAKSSRAATLTSLLFSLIISFAHIKEVLAMYFGFEYFHKAYFQADLFQICANFVIFSLIGLLLWNVKKRFDNRYLN